ncbi:MAG: MATE family efflux transporter, partial [Coprobacillus sp.]
ENNVTMSEIAKKGLFIYFSGFFFVGINMISVSYFASTEKIKHSFTISILRSGLVIIPILLVFSQLFGLTGVWLSYPISEFIILMIVFLFHKQHKKNQSLETE